MTHICISKLTIIGSDNGLSPDRRQAIIWTNPGILLTGPLGTNFSEILIEIHAFSFRKMHLKMLSGKWWPFCLGLNVLKTSKWNVMLAIGQTFTYTIKPLYNMIIFLKNSHKRHSMECLLWIQCSILFIHLLLSCYITSWYIHHAIMREWFKFNSFFRTSRSMHEIIMYCCKCIW